MKKIALTSLLAVFAAAGANAANIIDGNPLYMPKAGHFYSETALSSHSEHTKNWTLGEEFGYGITNKLAVSVNADLYEGAEEGPDQDDEMFDSYGLGNLAVKATFRALDMGAWKVDAYGKYASEGATIFAHSDAGDVNKDHNFWFDKDLIDYSWTAGVRGGYTTPVFTVAGHLEFVYGNTESFNWSDEGTHAWKLGVDGQYVIDRNWNLVAGVEYTGITDDIEVAGVKVKNMGTVDTYLGVNYNIDATKYVGAFITHELDHWKGEFGEPGAEKGWGFKDGFGFGVKFGIDF